MSDALTVSGIWAIELFVRKAKTNKMASNFFIRDMRLLIFAKLMNPGETAADIILTAIQINPFAIFT